MSDNRVPTTAARSEHLKIFSVEILLQLVANLVFKEHLHTVQIWLGSAT